jgi:hypothetical protein
MKYMLLMYASESELPQYTPEQFKAAAKVWQAYVAEAEAAGVLVANNGLANITDATTVRVRQDKTLTTDGPFAETHEQLGGFFLLDCKDLDEAISWAARIPSAEWGSIEIRPLYLQQ